MAFCRTIHKNCRPQVLTALRSASVTELGSVIGQALTIVKSNCLVQQTLWRGCDNT